MAYHEISTMDIWEVIRRWHNKQGIREISRSLGYDRKTIRNYISFATKKGLSLDLPLPPREEVLLLLQEIGETLGRTPKVQFILQPYLTEICRGPVQFPSLESARAR